MRLTRKPGARPDWANRRSVGPEPRERTTLRKAFAATPDHAAIVKGQSETSRSAGRSLCLVDNLAAGGGRSDEFVKEGVGDAQ